jgi:hypothetical protein
VIKMIGEIGDVAIAEIMGTGATVDELTEAQAGIANDETQTRTTTSASSSAKPAEGAGFGPPLCPPSARLN